MTSEEIKAIHSMIEEKMSKKIAQAVKTLDQARHQAIVELDESVGRILDQLKIEIPVESAAKVLAEGGWLTAFDWKQVLDEDYDIQFEVRFNGRMDGDKSPHGPTRYTLPGYDKPVTLKPGRYRTTVIIERLGDLK